MQFGNRDMKSAAAKPFTPLQQSGQTAGASFSVVARVKREKRNHLPTPRNTKLISPTVSRIAARSARMSVNSWISLRN